MKPDTRTAMTHLIREARDRMPLNQAVEEICGDDCNGCSVKLLEFVSAELDGWEGKLNDGAVPNLGEINKLAKTCTKIYAILKKNGVV